MLSPATVKSALDSLISGGSTVTPSSLAWSMYSATLLFWPSTEVSSAAMYSLGWWNFSQAV